MNWFYALPVLVTGGAGFIGSHLVEELVELGAHVRLLDNLSTGSLANLEKVIDKITFIKGDITSYNDCLTASNGVSVIFHLAAFISVPESLQNPSLCFKTNVLGTLNLLQAAVQNHVSNFIFSSSSAVYGTTDKPCTESMPGKPESPYGHSKLLGEQLCRYYAEQFCLTSVVLRYFNVYGSRQNSSGFYAGVVAKFTALLEQNKPLIIYGDGLQTRDFVPVQDIVKANIQLASRTKTGNYDIFNIATGKSITLLDLVEKLRQKYPCYNLPITFLPERPGDITHSKADCSKYQNYLKELF